MSIPLYYLLIYHVPNSILDNISKLVRKFLWSSSGDRSGIHLVNWTETTHNHYEEGLGIKNPRFFRQSLMANNVFSYLNNHNVFWVNLLWIKYGLLNFWMDDPPMNCSWFFRWLCQATKIWDPSFGLNLLILLPLPFFSTLRVLRSHLLLSLLIST